MAHRTTTKRKKSSKKPLFYGLSLLALVVVVLGVLELTHTIHLFHSKQPVAQTSGPTAAQKKTEEAVDAKNKEDLIKNPQASVQSSTTNTTTPSQISLSAHQESNGTVTVLTNVGPLGSGTCQLTVTNGSKTNSQTANVIYAPTYSTCAGFSVPISALGTGTWSIALSITGGGTSTSKTIALGVQ